MVIIDASEPCIHSVAISPIQSVGISSILSPAIWVIDSAHAKASVRHWLVW